MLPYAPLLLTVLHNNKYYDDYLNWKWEDTNATSWAHNTPEFNLLKANWNFLDKEYCSYETWGELTRWSVYSSLAAWARKCQWWQQTVCSFSFTGHTNHQECSTFCQLFWHVQVKVSKVTWTAYLILTKMKNQSWSVSAYLQYCTDTFVCIEIKLKPRKIAMIILLYVVSAFWFEPRRSHAGACWKAYCGNPIYLMRNNTRPYSLSKTFFFGFNEFIMNESCHTIIYIYIYIHTYHVSFFIRCRFFACFSQDRSRLHLLQRWKVHGGTKAS